jgi:hypothetical protein
MMNVVEQLDTSPRAVAAQQGIFYGLFKVVAIADLAGTEEAVKWARELLEDEKLMGALAEEIGERAPERPVAVPPRYDGPVRTIDRLYGSH